MVCMAQSRVVKGVVVDVNNSPLSGITISAENATESTTSAQDGQFEINVSPYTKYIVAAAEGYITDRAEIDGSFLILRLKVDKKYFENKLKAEEEARLAAEKEAKAKAKAEEEARLAAEKEAKAKAKAEEEARIAAQKQAEAERIAKEKEAAAKAKAEEEARIAAQKQAETERIAKEKEAAAKANAEEAARIAAQKQAEAERIAKEKEAAAKAKAEEAARIAVQKQAEAERIAKEKAEIAAAKKKKRDALRIEYAKSIKGYESFVSTSYSMTNNESFIGVDYIRGERYNNIFLGVGISANMRLTTPISQIEMNEALELSHGAFYLPVYAHFRAQLLNRRCTPFLALSAGYNISLPQSFDLELTRINYNASGAFVNPQFGVTYRIKPKLGIYCAVGFNACMMPECIGNTGYSATIKQSFKYGINVNLGISF